MKSPNRLIILSTLFILHLTTLAAIEVSGHITSDTVWSSANNPYEVVGNIFIEEDVTLTILPGTHIKIGSALLNNANYVSGQYFMLWGEESVAGMFWVNGSIIAEATPEDPILFTRDTDELYYHWGTIFFDDTSLESSFSHCVFQYASLICASVWDEYAGVFTGKAAVLQVSHCSFIDNYKAINLDRSGSVEILHNSFALQQGINPDWLDGQYSFIAVNNDTHITGTILLAGNSLPDTSLVDIKGMDLLMVDNELTNCYLDMFSTYRTDYYLFDNQFNCYEGNASHSVTFRTYQDLFCKKNVFTGEYGSDLWINCWNRIFVDNVVDCHYGYLNGSNSDYNGFARGNIISVYRFIVDGSWSFFNSVIDAHTSDIYDMGVNFYNSILSIPFLDISFEDDTNFINCFLLNDLSVYQGVFQNCITTFEIPAAQNAGGCFQVTENYLQYIFQDYQQGDYHLVPGCLAVDAGCDTVSSYPFFDLDTHHRVWDGDGDGQAVIDIGPYEDPYPYGYSPVGKISGITWSPANGEVVDYVLLTIDDNPAEFTFSDSSGCYEIPLPAGTYNVHARRLFYEDAVEYAVEVIDGEVTQLDIAMGPTVEAGEEPHAAVPGAVCNLRNYPNPFNPVTTVSFSLSSESKVSVDVFNIKGQKVKQILNEKLTSGTHEIQWDGRDASNKASASGVYFVKVATEKDTDIRKMLLLK
jgi:hypothetical protein